MNWNIKAHKLVNSCNLSHENLIQLITCTTLSCIVELKTIVAYTNFQLKYFIMQWHCHFRPLLAGATTHRRLRCLDF